MKKVMMYSILLFILVVSSCHVAASKSVHVIIAVEY